MKRCVSLLLALCLLMVMAAASAKPSDVEPELQRVKEAPSLRLSASGLGSIEGTVRFSTSMFPIQDATIRLHRHIGGEVTSTSTDFEGRYRFDALPVGHYYVTASGEVGEAHALQAQLHPMVDCMPACSNLAQGRRMMVAGDQHYQGIDFLLKPGARIAGTVSSADGFPMNHALVVLYLSSDPYWVDYRFVAASGGSQQLDFEFGGLPADDYYLAVRAAPASTADYLFVPRGAHGEECGLRACMVGSDTLTLHSVDDSIDLQLAMSAVPYPGETVQVSTAAGDLPGNSRVTINLYDSEDRWVGWWSRFANGAIGPQHAFPLPATVRGVLEHRPVGLDEPSFQVQMYDGIDCGLAPCPLQEGATLSAQATMILTPAGSISGAIRDREFDQPLPGVTVRLHDASGVVVGSSVSDAQGNYRLHGLPDGSYQISTQNPYRLLDQHWPGRPCRPACNFSVGEAIQIDAAQQRTGYVFELWAELYSDSFETP